MLFKLNHYNFIYMKQVVHVQLILITPVGNDVALCGSKTGVPGGNPPVQLRFSFQHIFVQNFTKLHQHW